MSERDENEWIELPMSLEASVVAANAMAGDARFSSIAPLTLRIGDALKPFRLAYVLEADLARSEGFELSDFARHDVIVVAAEMALLADYYRRLAFLADASLRAWEDPENLAWRLTFSYDTERQLLWPTADFVRQVLDVGYPLDPTIFGWPEDWERSPSLSFAVSEIRLLSPLWCWSRIRGRKARFTTTHKVMLACALMTAAVAAPVGYCALIHPNPAWTVEMAHELDEHKAKLVDKYVQQMTDEMAKGSFRTIQTLLYALRYDPGSIDGRDGPRTEEAARAFVHDNPNLASGISISSAPFFFELARAYVDRNFKE